ncbi:hypothetical protein MPTK1_1g10000 [Marchantia polymorpha subsp. ruderalis]|uniref:Uncharacterized protein n=2 Tax=Marchantia polymorpha TaxID=3197 RepID=A0AAF6ANH2_MARPO|nr:hypothetical protein MARPO_0096s0001 [Marchantia polymorpha]BBM97992.1 hypothetical protein Mp_1g10000 [Marchantia polymorpha subsp. ruderalis]|eukprot:PTQ32638.1 hypothetical protein MARPO_0096s0001 [Marchantia polymorpha]
MGTARNPSSKRHRARWNRALAPWPASVRVRWPCHAMPHGLDWKVRRPRPSLSLAQPEHRVTIRPQFARSKKKEEEGGRRCCISVCRGEGIGSSRNIGWKEGTNNGGGPTQDVRGRAQTDRNSHACTCCLLSRVIRALGAYGRVHFCALR